MNYYPLDRDNEENRKKDDGSGGYRYARPENGRFSFSDAGYIPQKDAPVTPRSYGEIPDRPKRKRKFSTAGIIALCLVCALLGAAAGFGVGWADVFSRDTEIGAPAAESARGGDTAKAGEPSAAPLLTSKSVTGETMAASDIYTMACSQVVGVTTEVTYTNAFGMTSSGAVTGSGFILTGDGYILTNYHVIEYAAKGNYKISVILYNGDTYEAKIVGYESDDNDIAVLKIEAAGLNPATLGSSDSMHVGDTVYAVGNPLGELAYTMTRGMISALDRDITTQDSTTRESKTINMFQFDAAVNSGNSGGPVYNEYGEVIGVVTAKYSNAGVEGLGFGIPINDAVEIANELIEHGYVSGKAYMGISVQTVSSEVARYYNMVEGAYVYTVDSSSCAAKAGLQMGDIITAIDGKEIKTSSDLVSAKKKYKAGDTAKLTVYRGGKYLELSITFDEDKNKAAENAAESGSRQRPGNQSGGFGSYGFIW